jgi:hypothetical protein
MIDRAQLSVFVTTFNNGRTLTACLESVRWADEIVMLDSFSTDDTLAIAGVTGRGSASTSSWDMAAQKRMALAATTHDWVLLLDADEALSPALQDRNPPTAGDGPAADGYEMPRQEQLFWRMYHPATRMNYYLRLFDKRKGDIDDMPIHAAPKVQGSDRPAQGAAVPLRRNRHSHQGRENQRLLDRLGGGQTQEKTLGYRPDHVVLPAAVFHPQLPVQAQLFERLGGIDQLGDRGVLRLSQIRQAIRALSDGSIRTRLLPEDAPAPPIRHRSQDAATIPENFGGLACHVKPASILCNAARLVTASASPCRCGASNLCDSS